VTLLPARRHIDRAHYTAARTGETLGATWKEFDFDAALWAIPAKRMKAAREHRVPLAARAVEILRELSRNRLPRGRYSPLHAAGAYQLRRRREALIEKDRALRTFVDQHSLRS
jgi:integrase